MNTTTIISSGNRAGKASAFCKAMGWPLRAYQRVFLLVWTNHERYKPFIPARRVSQDWFREWWLETHPKKTWHTVWVEEAYFAPKS